MYCIYLTLKYNTALDETIRRRNKSTVKSEIFAPGFFSSKVPKYYLIYFASNKNECVENFFGGAAGKK